LIIIDNKLLYKETPIYDKSQDYKNPTFKENTREHVIFSNLNNAKFIYEKAIDLPKDKYFKTNIPKLIILTFERDNTEFKYIFDVKYNFYELKRYLKSKREVN